MESRLIFLHHPEGVISEGGTEKGRWSGDWLCRFKPVGGSGRQIRCSLTPRGDDERFLRVS
jgi:hypothetical protein